MFSNNITEDNGSFYMEVSSKFTDEYSFRVPKVLVVMNELFRLFTSVLIPTFFIVTGIFIFVFLFTDISEETAFVLGIPVQFVVMFGLGYKFTDGVKDLINVKRKITKRGWMYILTGLISLIIMNFLAEFVIGVLDISIGTNKIVSFVQSNPESIILVIPAMFLFVAPVEEFVFRGIIQGKAREYYNARNAILLSGFYFGIVHVVSMTTIGYGMLVYAVISMMLGFILGYIYEETNNLLVPILAHGAYNSVLFIVLIL